VWCTYGIQLSHTQRLRARVRLLLLEQEEVRGGSISLARGILSWSHYARLGKKALRLASRYAHGRQMKRAGREIKL
jgi:hypothetical protein